MSPAFPSVRPPTLAAYPVDPAPPTPRPRSTVGSTQTPFVLSDAPGHVPACLQPRWHGDTADDDRRRQRGDRVLHAVRHREIPIMNRIGMQIGALSRVFCHTRRPDLLR